MMQADEPGQKNCVYKLSEPLKKNIRPSSRPSSQGKKQSEKYQQIRVKSIEFLGQKAFAVYFYDFTHHLESLKLDLKYKTKRNENKQMVKGQTMISQEYWAPLQNVLMLLESMFTGDKATTTTTNTVSET